MAKEKKSVKEIQDEINALIQQQKQISANANEYRKLLRTQSELTEQQKIKLKLLEDERKLYAQNSKAISQLSTDLDAAKDRIRKSLDFTNDLSEAFVSISNTVGKTHPQFNSIVDSLKEAHNVTADISREMTSSAVDITKNEEAVLKVSAAYVNMKTAIAEANAMRAAGEITESERISILQKESELFMDISKKIDMSEISSSKLRDTINGIKSEARGIFDDMKTEHLFDTKPLDDIVVKMSNAFGETSEYVTQLNMNLAGTQQAVESIAEEIRAGGAGTEENAQSVMDLADAYRQMKVDIADINAEYMQGKISEQERVAMIKEATDNLSEMANAIDMSVVSSNDLKDSIVKIKGEADAYSKSMQNAQLKTQAMDQVFDSFGGVPAMREINTLLKTNIKDTLAWKAAVAAVGAALGAAAGEYFGAPMKAGMEASYQADKAGIDAAKNIAKIESDSGFIRQQNMIEAGKQGIETENQVAQIRHEGAYTDQKVALEAQRTRLDGAQQVARAMMEAGAAQIRAARQFSDQMQVGAATFAAQAKTALFGNKLGSINYGAAQMQLAGIGADKVAAAMMAAGKVMGKMPSSEIASDMAVLAERTGQSAEDIAQLNSFFQRTEGVSEKTAINLQEGLRAMADQAGLNLGELMKEVADASKDALSYQIQSGKALAKQVAYTQSIGVNFGDIAKAGKSMVLNYKDSIKAEMQLSTLLGKQVDLAEVRQKFAEGDTTGALEALKAQGLDPAQMDMFQQQALQDALGGMDLSSLQKIATKEGKKTGDLKEGDAEKEGKAFLKRKESAESVLNSQQAAISAKTAVFDAQLSASINNAYVNSEGYKNYQKQLNELAAKDAELAGSISKAYLESPEYEKYKKGLAEMAKQDEALTAQMVQKLMKDKKYQELMAKEMQLDFKKGLLDAGFKGLTSILGAGIALMGDKIAGGVAKSVMGGLAKTGIGKKITSFFGGGGGAAPPAPTVPGTGGPGGGPGGPGGGPDIGDAQNKVGAVQKIFDTIKEILGGIRSTILEIIKTIKEVGVELVKTVGDIVGQVIDTVKSVGGKLIETLGELGGKILTVATDLTGKFGTLLEKVAEIITNVGNKIAEGGMKIFNTVIDGLTKASNSMPTILGNLGKAIGSFFQGIGPGLLAFGEMMATPTAFFGIPAGAIVLAMMMGIAAALRIAAPAIETLTPLLIGLADSIGGTFVEMLKAAAPIIESVFDGISKVIKTVGDAIVGIINSITNSIVTFSQIDAMGLLAAAGGIAAVAGALALYGAGSLIGGIMDGIGKFFGGDPVEKFRKFATIDGGALQSVAKGVGDLGTGLRNFSTGNLSAIPGALKTLNEGINKNLSTAAANLMSQFGTTIKNLSDTLVTFAGAITKINSEAVQLDATTAAFERLGGKLLEFPKLSDIQPAIDGIKAVSQASPTPESAQAFYVWNTAFTGFNQNMVTMSGYPQLVAQLVPMFEQLTMVTNKMGNELNLISQVPFANFLGLAAGLKALGLATPTFEMGERLSVWNEEFGSFTNTILTLTTVSEGLLSVATNMDSTAIALLHLADAFKEFARIDIDAINSLPWIRMTAFAAAGGKITVAQQANKSFNVTQDTAKNIESIKSADKIQAEKVLKDSSELIKLTKNVQALVTVLAQGDVISEQQRTASIKLFMDGTVVSKALTKREANKVGGNPTPPDKNCNC
jgi:hypothetical protein